MAVAILFIILGVVQLGDCTYSPGANKLCLSCQGIQDPRACTHFVQAWNREVCTTERVVLINGTTVWNMGYEAGITCQANDVIELTRMRSHRIQATGIVVCHECCHTDLCNSKLCGSTFHNGLVCLKSDTDVVYCNQTERCYAIQPRHSRPGQLRYGCASQAMCSQIPENRPHATCQSCCHSDGCNIHACSDPSVTLFADCWDLHNRGGFTQDGVYDIYPPPGNSRIRVRCDMQTGGGGWIVIFRRYDGSLSFVNRTFNDYATGVGEPSGEFFFSLDHIHQLTSHGNPLTLRLDFCDRSLPHSLYAEYETFSIESRNDSYRLRLGSYSGTAPNRMGDFNSTEFSVTNQCRVRYGAWWHPLNICSPGLTDRNYPTAYKWSAAEMKIRPMFAKNDSTVSTCSEYRLI